MAETATGMQENQTGDNQERTFTQAELDSILQNRIAKERAKYSDYESIKEKASKFDEMEEANKSELQKATERATALQKQLDELNSKNAIRDIREKVAAETGVPARLLTGSTEEECKSLAEDLLSFKNEKTNKYPTVKDGGEVVSKVPKKSPEEQFADWFSASLGNH